MPDLLNRTMPADYHTHTPLCRHAEGTPEEFVSKAATLGLTHYGIADHAPADPEPFDDWRMLQSEIPQYLDWIQQAKELASDKDVTIRAGLECDWISGCEPWTETLLQLYDWDYLIGSVHYLHDKWDFDNPKWLGRWAEIDVDQAWQNYFAAYKNMVDSGLFDIHAHPDLIKKFNFRPKGDLNRYYEPVIESLANSGSCIELNTAGWHKPCEEAYPSFDFLKLAASANVSLVISSDAHTPEHLGRDFDLAITLAKKAGYTHTQLFKRGHQTPELLPAS